MRIFLVGVSLTIAFIWGFLLKWMCEMMARPLPCVVFIILGCAIFVPVLPCLGVEGLKASKERDEIVGKGG